MVTGLRALTATFFELIAVVEVMVVLGVAMGASLGTPSSSVGWPDGRVATGAGSRRAVKLLTIPGPFPPFPGTGGRTSTAGRRSLLLAV